MLGTPTKDRQTLDQHDFRTPCQKFDTRPGSSGGRGWVGGALGQPASNNVQPLVFNFFLHNCFIISPNEGPKIKKSRETIKFECQIADIQPSGDWCLLLSLPPAVLNSPKLEFYSCKFDWNNQCPVDQSKCIFKVVVGVFDIERKCHVGTPQLSYITRGGGGGGGTICDFSADYSRQHSVRILGSILFCWLANIFLIWSRQGYFTHFEPSQS